MEKLQYKLDVFEGPMDLLLHLINKHKLNINDIPIEKHAQKNIHKGPTYNKKKIVLFLVNGNL